MGIGSTPSLIVGIAAGGAASAAFEPALEVPRQQAWASAPNRLPDVGLIAELVAGGKVSLKDGRSMANRLGFSNATFDSVTWLAQNRLDFPAMLRLWRRFGAFDSTAKAALDKLVDETLAHETLDWDYQPWLKKMYDAELVGLGDIATAVVRGALPAPDYMPVAPPTTTSKVKRFPQVQIDPEQLAEALGYSKEMLHLMVARSGLSLAPIFAANAFFRGIIEDDDFLLAIAEGDLRTEWAEVLKDAARQIPTVGEAVQWELRGFTDRAGRLKLTRRHGMVDDDSDVVFDISGRAPAVHAVTTGLARGAQYPGSYDMVPEPYKSAIQRSDIRPEFADIVYHDRFGYPSGFQIRAEAQNGDLSEAEAEQILLEVGWKPEWAKFFATKWAAKAGGVSADPHVTKAQNHLWTAVQKSYIAREVSDSAATVALGAAGVAAAAIPTVLTTWQAERDLIRKSLTATQIKKAYTSQTTNPDTGVAWTLQDAVTRLLELGYDQSDATTLLEE